MKLKKGDLIMKRFKSILLIMLMLSMIITTSCSTKPAVPAAPAPAAPAPAAPAPSTPTEKKVADKIVIGRIQDSDDLDPVTQDGNVNIWMFNLVLEGLVKTSDDGTSIEPGLAEKWEISPDGLTYTFHIKKGLKFSDGTPVTGEDWVWSLERTGNTPDSTWLFASEGMVDVTAPDDVTVVITLDQARSSFLAQLAMFNMTVQNKAYYDKIGQVEYSQKPMGTGPYMIKEWKIGEYLSLEKNPEFYMEGLPKTKEILFTVVPDDNTRSLQLESGQIDVATFVPFTKMAELDAKDDLVAFGIPSTESRYVVFNNGIKPFDDIRVRKAMQHGTNKKEMVEFILQGYGSIATSFAPPAGLFYNDKLVPYEYDVEKAKALLAEAGYPNGFEVEVLVRAGNAVYEQMAVVLKQQWAQIGVTANILSLESATAVAKYRALEHEITFSGWTNDMNDPMQQVEYVVIPEVVSAYYTQWVNQEAIDLVQAGKLELDNKKREDIYLKIQELHHADTPMMPVFHSSYPVAMYKNIEGFVQTPLGNYRFENLVKYID